MNDLKGKFVNIVLSIEEGRGFDSVKNNVYITANFNGRIMESDMMDIQPNIIFNTEMVWETEKKLLRKARGAYTRIRIECFTDEKKFIGFVLLCLRSAKILPSSRTDFTVQYTWNKLLNVPTEFKKGTPELNVSLTIRDYITNKVIPPALSTYECATIDSSPNNKVQTIPVRYTKHGFIQVGSNDQQLDKYIFKITIRVASNLDLLLPETLVFSQVPKKYYLSFAIFGMNVKTRPIARDLHDNISINETVVINLLSNFNNLGMYFQEYPSVDVTFYNDETKLGWTKINFSTMGWDMESAVFHNWCNGKLEVEEESYFVHDMLGKTSTGSRCPSLNTRSTIELRNDKEAGQGDKEDVYISPRVRYSSCDEGELLIDNKLRGLSSIERKSTFLQNLAKIEEKCDPSNITLIKEPSTPQSQCEINPIDGYRQFCLDIILDSISWKKPVKTTNFVISFQHPKSNSCLRIKTEIDKQVGRRILLENAVCKLMFICSRGRIGLLLENFAPRLQFLDNKNQPISQEIVLDCSKLSPSKPELSESVNMKSAKNEELAELNVCLFLETCKLNSDGRSHFDLLPHILDDNIVFYCLDDLERWKQDEIVKCSHEIERKKKVELEVLQEEWISRKNKLERDLKSNIARCKKLSYELKKNAENMMLDKVLEERKEQDEEFNWSLEIHKNTVKYSLFEHHEFIEKISELERDSIILRDILSEQSLEMQEIKKTALTGEQTKNLLHDLKKLEEKYEEALRDKNYFKSEWEKAAKEVHNLKIENQKAIQDKIATEKEQLSQLSLETFSNLEDT